MDMTQRSSVALVLLLALVPSARVEAWQAAGDVTKDSSATISSSADRVGEPAAAPNPDSTAAVASAPAEPLPAEPLPAKRPLGWLSDPGKAPENIFEAIFTGKIHLDNRLRLELADTTAKDSSTAITNRLRLGYETKAFHGLSGMIEMESVVTPDKGNYFVPQTMQGTSSRTVVADPVGTELNQAWGRFMAKAIGDSAVSLDLKVGRQRVKLDDERFIGAYRCVARGCLSTRHARLSETR